MALQAGARFGPYEVVEQIGSGGMGEVWRARDTRLKRDVAIKVLPEAFAADTDRLARFQREAEILASLNHANIATIHGLEKTDGQTVIVMELVDGPTLADRIADGPLPPDEAMGVALQIASALEAAHSRQIVHRDLKPANVKLKEDGTVKVLDFGISKPLDAAAISGGAVLTTPAVTQTGVILGTAAYMSPEQARGKPVDQRTDIWAFGCLLFEMLTGQPAFGGEDIMATLARVIDRDTDLSSMPGTISVAVRHTIKLCLEKNPDRRISDIRDVRLALEGAFDPGPRRNGAAGDEPASRRSLPMAAAAILLALVVGAAAWYLKPGLPPDPEVVARFDYLLPEGTGLRNTFTSVLDVAPNGEFFVFNGTGGIYLRPMGDVESRVIPGTDTQTAGVAVSPDGREIAYFSFDNNAQTRLVRIAVGGGAPIVLADGLTNGFGLSWEPDGTILFGQEDGIWRVAENGGTPVRIVETEPPEQAYGPQLLPGGEWLLFTLAAGSADERWNQADIVVQSLETGERRVLRSGGADARYLPTGHLIYVFENVLFASAFDLATLGLGDERVSLIQGVRSADFPGPNGGAGFYAVSNDGTLVYIPGSAGPARQARPRRGLVWVDRPGNTEAVPVRADDYTIARISPDGTKVALVVGLSLPRSDPPPDIYIFDLETENLSQLTFDPETDDGPVWSPDGNRIFFRSFRDDGEPAVYQIPSEGGTAELVLRSPTNNLPWSVSPDGETLLLVTALTTSDFDIARFGIDSDNELTPLIDNDGWVNEPMLSPNGQWIVHYTSPEISIDPSASEINLRPYPNVTQQRRPIGRGVAPVFSADGSEIFFFDGQGLSAVSVAYDPFRVGVPETLFRGQYWYGGGGPSGLGGRAWDVDPNNDRFLMITAPDAAPEADTDTPQLRISVVLNWFDELNERVPVE